MKFVTSGAWFWVRQNCPRVT